MAVQALKRLVLWALYTEHGEPVDLGPALGEPAERADLGVGPGRAERTMREERRARAEHGVVVLELVVASVVLVVVSMMGFIATQATLRVSSSGLAKAQATTVSAVALSQLREETSSANILYDPANEGSNAGRSPDGTSIPAGFSLRIYTQANGIFTCMQWRVLDTGALQTRSWSDQWQTNGEVGNWVSLLTGITNPTGTPPFVLDQGANYGGSASSRLLDVDLLLGAKNLAQPVEVQSSIAGRDAEYYPQNTGDCTPVPTP